MISARVRGTVALLAAIALGLALGATGERLWLARAARSPRGVMDSHALISEMDRRLHLDPSQRDAIRRILNRHQAAIDSAWAVVRPSVHGAIDSSQMEILDVLNPAQRAPYLAWLRVAHRGVGPTGPLWPRDRPERLP
ncbi:MAG: hypothetical protein ABI408_08440 [Gemmatimonadaceae bacterium]